MSTISGERVRVEAPVQPQGCPRLDLLWSLPEGTAGLAGPVHLCITVEGEACDAALVHTGGRVELKRSTPIALERDSERALWHAGAPGVFTATWRTRPGCARPQILYARSPLIERLNVPGGAYEFRGLGGA